MRCTLQKGRQQEAIRIWNANAKATHPPPDAARALLLALVLIMSYTPLGYLPVGPLALSLLTIPVAVGAMRAWGRQRGPSWAGRSG